MHVGNRIVDHRGANGRRYFLRWLAGPIRNTQFENMVGGGPGTATHDCNTWRCVNAKRIVV